MPVFVSEQFGSSWLINDTSNSWKGTSASAAIFRATSISRECFCPYVKHTASTREKCFLAQNRQVVESCPPEKHTKAASFLCFISFLFLVRGLASTRKRRHSFSGAKIPFLLTIDNWLLTIGKNIYCTICVILCGTFLLKVCNVWKKYLSLPPFCN